MLFIIPALDDNDAEMVQSIHEILFKTEKIVGTSKLYGEIWKTMLRSPRARLTAIKYLDLKIPKNIDDIASINLESPVRDLANLKQSFSNNAF